MSSKKQLATESTPLAGGDEAEKTGIVARLKRNGELVGAVIFFMACSSGMLLVNKAVMLAWDLPMTVTIIQLAFCSVVLCFPPFVGQMRVGSWADARKWALWVPWLFAGMLATSMLALRYSSTGAVVVTRNIAPILTIGIEAALKEKVQIDVWTVAALALTLIGVVLYMMNDIQFNALGFLFIILNMLFAVGDRVLQRRLLAVDPVDLSNMALLLIANIGALIPVAVILLPATQEYKQWHTLRADDPDGPDNPAMAYFWLVLSCILGIAIGYAGILVQSYLTATSFMVLGNVNKFIVIGVGIVSMHEAKSWEAILGCLLAIGGGLLYALARNRLADKAKAEAAAKAAAGPGAKV